MIQKYIKPNKEVLLSKTLFQPRHQEEEKHTKIKELVQSELNTSPEHQKGEEVYIFKMILMTSVSQQVVTFAFYLG